MMIQIFNIVNNIYKPVISQYLTPQYYTSINDLYSFDPLNIIKKQVVNKKIILINIFEIGNKFFFFS